MTNGNETNAHQSYMNMKKLKELTATLEFNLVISRFTFILIHMYLKKPHLE